MSVSGGMTANYDLLVLVLGRYSVKDFCQSNNKIKSSRQDKCESVCISIFQIIHTAFSGEQLDDDLSLPQLFRNNVSCEQCLRKTSSCGILRGGEVWG